MATSPLHVCYALAMDGDPAYADLIAISARCVRRIYPAARITILTDDKSLRNLGSALPRLAGFASDIRSVGKFVGDPRFRSRFVKTQARSFIRGDFLYLDADTVTVSEFGKIFECKAPISAAIDRNRVNPSGGFPAWVVPAYDRLRWPHPTKFYLNGGVVFWKDCKETHALGRAWHNNWLRYATTLQNPADQPAFNRSISQLGIEPEIMDDVFNARVSVSPDFAKGACIYHFYIEGDEKPEGTIIDALMARYREDGQVDFSLIDEAARRGHPWIGELGK